VWGAVVDAAAVGLLCHTPHQRLAGRAAGEPHHHMLSAACSAHCMSTPTAPNPAAQYFSPPLPLLYLACHAQTPTAEDRATPARPKATVLYTGEQPGTAAALSAGLLRGPALSAGDLLSLQSYLEGWAGGVGANASGGVVPGEALSLLGLRLGSASRISAGLFIEPALVPVRGMWG
jgi:hypothetical protein